jgi:hypothetical protein
MDVTNSILGSTHTREAALKGRTEHLFSIKGDSVDGVQWGEIPCSSNRCFRERFSWSCFLRDRADVILTSPFFHSFLPVLFTFRVRLNTSPPRAEAVSTRTVAAVRAAVVPTNAPSAPEKQLPTRRGGRSRSITWWYSLRCQLSCHHKSLLLIAMMPRMQSSYSGDAHRNKGVSTVCGCRQGLRHEGRM